MSKFVRAWTKAKWLRGLGAIILAVAASGAGSSTHLFGQNSSSTGPDLDQGWTPADIVNWSKASQGSRLIPYSWLQALEQGDSSERFLNARFVDGLRYLPGIATSKDPNPLPMGFAIDQQSDEELLKTRLRWFSGQADRELWVGLNCAACHTARVTYGGASMTIHGAPTMANFQVFMEELLRALRRTRDDSAKFDRFAAAVLRENDAAGNRTMLRAALSQHTAWYERIASINSSSLRYGFGRLDAVGHILNKLALVLDEQRAAPRSSDAPVSYPFIWNVPQHDFVQWNGMAGNTPDDRVSAALTSLAGQPFDVGGLGRNVGEVVGVFGDINPARRGVLGGVASSVNVRNLIEMEQLLGRLRPPQWPAEVFGPIDEAKRLQGEKLFQERCASCHAPLGRQDLTSRFQAIMAPLTPANRPSAPRGRRMTTEAALTDPAMACNTITFTANAGFLAGTKSEIALGGRVARTDSGDVLLTGLVQSILTEQAATLGWWALQSRLGWDAFDIVPPPPSQPRIRDISGRIVIPFGLPQEARDARCLRANSVLVAYKARPLTGIWATAPYLHNGSVVSLYELLLPPAQRRTSFCTGTREFDPVNVGYRAECLPENPFRFSTRDADGNPLRGNSNFGHDYGNANLSEADRRALVEYLKTL